MFPQITPVSAEAHSTIRFTSSIPAKVALVAAEIPFGEDYIV